MSVRKALFEELEKMGIDPSIIQRVEIRGGSTLLAYIMDNQTLKIKDPYLIRLAKLTSLYETSDPSLDSNLSREEILGRLYGIGVVYKGTDIPFTEFCKKLVGKSNWELGQELDGLEEAHKIDDKHTEFLKIKLYGSLLKQGGFGMSFADFSQSTEKFSTEDVLDLLTSFSNGLMGAYEIKARYLTL